MRMLKIVLPILVLLVGGAGMWALVWSREAPQTQTPTPVLPLIRTIPVELQTLELTVTSQGTVAPRTESVLVPEVSGKVIEVAPAFVSGGMFESGQTLLRIDAYDYRQAVVESQATVTQAELRVAQAEAEAQIARDEWEALGEGDATPLTLKQPQLAEAQAALEAAKARLERAHRDLERTTIRAPYAGRVRVKQVDVGQFVLRGSALATIYAVDYAEIRLPLPDEELAFVDLPLSYRGSAKHQRGPAVALQANFAGKLHTWEGEIVRTEGEIDPTSRMVHVIARVRDPFGRGSDPSRPPLSPGMFVEAAIRGRKVESVAVLPRSIVREGDQVLVVDNDNRLRFRDIEVLRSQGGEVVVRSGLQDGERVCASPLTAVTDGMRVRIDEAAL